MARAPTLQRPRSEVHPMATFDDIIEKVKKLLALSESSNPNEAALAQARAAELMLKYSIDLSAIDTSDDQLQADEPVDIFVFEADEGNKTTWKGSLAGSIATFFNCKIFWQGPSLMFVGRKSDNDSVKYLYKAIFNQIQELTEKFWIKEGIRSGTHGKTWKQSFRLGCVNTLQSRFAQQKTSIIQEYREKGTNLAIYDDLLIKVGQRVSKLTLRASAPVSAKSGAAYRSGTVAGNSINIGGNQGLGRPSYGIGNQALRLGNKG